MLRIVHISIVVVSLLSASKAAAGIYLCKGKDGGIHYTNVKQRGANCRLVVRGQKNSPRKQGTSHHNRHTTSRRSAGSQRPGSTSTPSKPGGTRVPHSPWTPPRRPHTSRCDDKPFGNVIRGAAALYSLPVAFLRAVMRVESRCNVRATSPKGAMGLMQLMPQTARSMGVSDPYDPWQNIYGGARYLRIIANRFRGDLALTLAAYNAGSGAVERYGGIPPYAETQRYVKKVTHYYYTAR